MRAKEPCYVISFHTPADAITFEKKAGETVDGEFGSKSLAAAKKVKK